MRGLVNQTTKSASAVSKMVLRHCRVRPGCLAPGWTELLAQTGSSEGPEKQQDKTGGDYRRRACQRAEEHSWGLHVHHSLQCCHHRWNYLLKTVPLGNPLKRRLHRQAGVHYHMGTSSYLALRDLILEMIAWLHQSFILSLTASPHAKALHQVPGSKDSYDESSLSFSHSKGTDTLTEY